MWGKIEICGVGKMILFQKMCNKTGKEWCKRRTPSPPPCASTTSVGYVKTLSSPVHLAERKKNIKNIIR